MMQCKNMSCNGEESQTFKESTCRQGFQNRRSRLLALTVEPPDLIMPDACRASDENYGRDPVTAWSSVLRGRRPVYLVQVRGQASPTPSSF